MTPLSIPARTADCVLWAAAIVGLYFTRHNFLLFHSLVEIFSIVIGFGIFVIAWNSRRFIQNNYLGMLGVAYLFVAAIDLLHTLAYKGMGVFPGHDANLPTQLWIGARYTQSFSLLLAPYFFERRLRIDRVVSAYVAAISLLLLTIFYWKVFPVCFVEGAGLTPFKKVSEYVITLILGAATVAAWRHREQFDETVLKLVLLSIALTMGSELAFTFYVEVYGLSNWVGHVFKILAFYLIYKALIETGLTRPYDLLFRNLKQSEEALRAREERLRLATDAASLGVFEMVTPSNQALWENERMYEIFGCDCEAAPVGREEFYATVIHPDDAEGFRDCLRGNMRQGKPFRTAFRIRRKDDGRLRWVEIDAIFHEASAETPARMTGVMADITERKLAEEELDRRIRERTAELATANVTLQQEIQERRRAEETLKTYAERLEQSNRDLEEFAFVASHDLQEPLRKIQAFGDRLKCSCSNVFDERALDYMTRMQNAAKRMQTLIHDLLRFSRVTTRAAEFATIDLTRLAREVIDDLETVIERSGGSVEIKELGTIKADSGQMRQLLQNLIGNALKYRGQVQPTITIESDSNESTEDGTPLFRLFVRDNGIGFDEKYVERIFKPFQRLHGKDDYPGTGMGLAICRRIVERHHGTITAKSSPGQGSTFIVTLPLAIPEGARVS